MIKRALVVDDHTEIRLWLVSVLTQTFPDIHILQAATLRQAQDAINPGLDLILLDLSLPDGMGYDLISAAKKLNPRVTCVAVTGFEDDEFLFPALQAGADGYLLKGHEQEEFCQLLAGIINGRPPLSPVIASRLIGHFHKPEPAHETAVNLTSREQETLRLLARGCGVKECASRMEISPHTVSGYIKEIYRKLQINSRAEAAVEAVKRGLT
jgi:DNA-binding NarL/FixJ family response regulator